MSWEKEFCLFSATFETILVVFAPVPTFHLLAPTTRSVTPGQPYGSNNSRNISLLGSRFTLLNSIFIGILKFCPIWWIGRGKRALVDWSSKYISAAVWQQALTSQKPTQLFTRRCGPSEGFCNTAFAGSVSTMVVTLLTHLLFGNNCVYSSKMVRYYLIIS
jgi:hypothetical protein